MSVREEYKADIEAILAKRDHLGADYWTTADKRLGKGGPFSTLEAVRLLLELGMDNSAPIFKEVADLIFSTWRDDGRFKLSPKGAIYPCHTINAANTLCHLGYAKDSRLQKTIQHLFDIQYSDGGWRCNKFIYGRGPETEYSNPFPTLNALDIFRFTDFLNQEQSLNRAVEFLLEHWTIRKPIGPCQYGIGTLFMQTEYPFGNYNLFYYLYVLSFYNRAREDDRFLEALNILESKMVDGKIVVERVNRKLSGFNFYKKGEPSELATNRYHDILKNLGRHES